MYFWADLSSPTTIPRRTGVTAGLYSVTVTDANSCEQIINGISVDNDCAQTCELPVVTGVTIQEATCNNQDATARIRISGDVRDYNFSWPGGRSGANQTNLGFGVYAVTISDRNDPSCSIVQEVVITNGDGPIVDVLSSPATCNEANGTAVLSPTTYLYEWCDGTTNFNNLNLSAGICYVTVTEPIMDAKIS